MKLPRWLGGKPGGTKTPELIGCWRRVRSEVTAEDEEAVELQITGEGALQYCTLTKGKWQIMKLTCRSEGDTLFTDQPSAPREERTRFSFDDGETLVLEYDGKKAWYRRSTPQAPAV